VERRSRVDLRGRAFVLMTRSGRSLTPPTSMTGSSSTCCPDNRAD